MGEGQWRCTLEHPGKPKSFGIDQSAKLPERLTPSRADTCTRSVPATGELDLFGMLKRAESEQ